MLRFIMRRNLPAGLFVVFERPDDALYVVFVDFFRGFRVSLYKQLMQRMCAVCSGIFLLRVSQRRILCVLVKVYIF